MRCKGNRVRGYSEEKEIMLKIELKNLAQTIEVVVDGFLKAFFRVGGQSEGFVPTAGNTPVDAWITDSHLSNPNRFLFFWAFFGSVVECSEGAIYKMCWRNS